MAQSMCVAEERIAKALYAMKNQRGSGVFNHPEIAGILEGPPCDCAEPKE